MNTDAFTTAEAVHGIEAVVEMARRTLRDRIAVNSCIAYCRVILELLRFTGIEAKPYACKLIVTDHTLNKAYAVGCTDEEMSTAQEIIPVKGTGAGWRGHLILIAEGDILIDPTFEAASRALYGEDEDDPAGYMVIALPETPGQFFDATICGKLDNGAEIEIRYIGTGDETWLESEAWNDEALPVFANALNTAVTELAHAMRATQ